MYDHQKSIILPKARYDWMHLRLQDFKTVNEYNSAMFKTVSQLRLCGDTITDEVKLEKIFTTFHASNMLLQQQYREKGMDPELKPIITHLAKLKKAMAKSDEQLEEAYAIKLQGDVLRYVLGPLYPLQPPDEVVKIWAEQSEDPPPFPMEFD
ncbi:hypothetical protein L3X38_036106 [Prunus dulcis]|uniref:Uncharacterized protein n=1 Tax=Prunus dulcis TaxID=3755 RepID=A0AAD4V255_PRUDU|nr:hypothetical protein L3X38_036106 [Prunus dulcis]